MFHSRRDVDTFAGELLAHDSEEAFTSDGMQRVLPVYGHTRQRIVWVEFAGTPVRFPPAAMVAQIEAVAAKNRVNLTKDVFRLD